MPIKIAVIGAGSVSFSRRLIQDILTVPELADSELALTDINQQYLDLVAQLVRRDVEANGLPTQVCSTLDRREAVDGADYVINVTRIGGLEAFEHRHRHPAEVRRRPVRRRHALRRRHHVRPAQHPAASSTSARTSARSPRPTACSSTTPTPTP